MGNDLTTKSRLRHSSPFIKDINHFPIQYSMCFLRKNSSLFILALQTNRDVPKCVQHFNSRLRHGGVMRFYQQLEDPMELQDVVF